MTTAEEHTRGWALAPARLAREDVAILRRLYVAAHVPVPPSSRLRAATVSGVLHADREDQRKLALAKLGRPAPHVLVRATVNDHNITVTVIAECLHVTSPHPLTTASDFVVATHRFRRTTPINEWTRILGRHCRHAFGVLAHLRAATLAETFA